MSFSTLSGNLSNLFKSKRRREREAEPRRRQAFRRAELAKEEVIAKQKSLEREGQDAWEKAFSGSQDKLAQLADEAIAEHRERRTEPLDPDVL